MAILDTYKPNAERVASLKKILETPESGSRQEITSLLLSKALAAEALGDRGLELSIRKRLLEMHRGLSDEIRFLMDLAGIEILTGNFVNGQEYRNEIITKTPRWMSGVLVGAYASHAVTFAQLGEIEQAELWMKRTEQKYGELMSSGNYPAWYRYDGRAIVAHSQASILQSVGKLAEAEQAFRRALDAAKEDAAIAELRKRTLGSSAPVVENAMQRLERIETRLALNLIAQGKLAEAELILRDQLSRVITRVGRDAVPVGEVLQALATSILEQGRFDDAESLFKIAEDVMIRSRVAQDSALLRNARVMHGEALLGKGNFRAANNRFEEARAGTERRRFLNGPTVLAAIRDRSTRSAAIELARDWFEQAKARYPNSHYEVGQARALLGLASIESNTNKVAILREISDGVEVMLAAQRGSQQIAGGALKRKMMVWILEDFMSHLAGVPSAAVQAGIDFDPVDRAFSISDVARGQSVQRAITASAARASIQDPNLANVIRREQDLGNELTSLYAYLSGMLAAPVEQQLPKVMADMRLRIAKIQQEREVLAADIERRFPAYANLINPKPPSLSDVKKMLKDGELFVSIYTGDEKTFVWAVSNKGEPKYSVVPKGSKEIYGLVGEVRRTVDPFSNGIQDIPQFNLKGAQTLYELILGPLADVFSKTTHLIVAANGALGQIPFAMLPTRVPPGMSADNSFANMRLVPWLIRLFPITQIPSANSLITLRALPKREAVKPTFVGFGDPIFSQASMTSSKAGFDVRGMSTFFRNAPQTGALDSAGIENLPRLPDTAEEILGIANVLEAANDDVYLQLRANEREVKNKNLSEKRVIVFATHGLVPGDINGLTQPALALSAPSVAGVDGDGLLTMDEILNLKMDADWVVLSACNTASGAEGGAEAISGLGKAFFYAGARSLLVSNWPVETVSAKLLTTGIFKRQAANVNLLRAEALRQTILALIDSGEAKTADGKLAYTYAHPLFWAPFTLVGDGG